MFSYSSQFFLFMEIIYGHITIYLDRNVAINNFHEQKKLWRIWKHYKLGSL